MKHIDYLNHTIRLAMENVESHHGGPFAAIIADKNGQMVSYGQNKVTSFNDPTAHAEIQAIRKACEKLQSFQLSGCILYTSCEPCPMCLGAIYWARVEKVYYAADQKLAAAGGFDDQFIYEEINKEHKARQIPFHAIEVQDKNLPFEKWAVMDQKVEY
ncbi:nucleoside deaminase [Jeotgalibacillus sp. S-D1]|uniref:nucleoside deaminase n=1 Tax=Jeotgalibacillus sp. S-D1 TaxID=2552189 RepID=UPI0010598881|nr:nucleoside deaminase [Jeotgalibacillus sp. S-D1]TDL34236.1 nucleoside deaminase [Jeotgalibacillus sp. S-D1]